MPTIRPLYWALAVMAVATLNIADVLPDWTTVAAILTIPLLATGNGACCGSLRRKVR